MFHITSIYAALVAILFIVLANIVSYHRARTGISILHGTDILLATWIRRHGNLAEAAPLALILMGLTEVAGATAPWLHAMGGALVLSRLLHVAGLDAVNAKSPLRIAGGVGTQLSMAGAVGFLLWTSLK